MNEKKDASGFQPLAFFVAGRRRHASLQYFTWSQTRSHFFRHANGLPQVTQVLVGRFGLR
jgi:hypothetical protein